jgi:alpha-acetolactate decarboxylase
MKKPLILASIALAATLVWAQPMGFKHFGHVMHMMHTGETAGQIQLSKLETSTGVWGVGALADLKGEIIQVDGKLLVSLGSDAQGKVNPPKSNDSAVLWASAKVTQWVSAKVPSDMNQAQFEAFAKEQAKAQKLDLEQPFVFRVSGDYAHLIWHVVTGDKSTGSGGHGPHGQVAQGGHGGGHANQQSGMKVFRNPQANGQLVGIYRGAKLEGVVSHPEERFHVHYIDKELTVSGHVDQYTVRAGATLWLPKK